MMAFKLDPREVLAHLNKLGYCNITTEQLRDFIRDLKKLIKYDQQQYSSRSVSRNTKLLPVQTRPETVVSHNLTSESSCSTKCDAYKTADKGSYRQQGAVECTQKQHKTAHESNEGTYRKNVDDAQKQPKSSISGKGAQSQYGTEKCVQKPCNPKSANACLWNDESDGSSTSSGDTSSSSTSSVDTYDVPCGIHHVHEHSKSKKDVKSKSVENLQEVMRPRSSFIKPWRLQVTALPQRSDPVALYHKYQSMWKEQKAPGENAHEWLRWSVREKMLGQDPHPRPVSRTSSSEVVNRRRKKTEQRLRV